MQVPIIGKVKRPARWIIGILAAGVIGGGLAAAVFLQRQRLASYDVEEFTIPVEAQPLAVRITASGSVESAETVNLSPRNSDLLVDLLVEQGDRVQEGQVIARMKSDDFEADVARARAQVEQTQARLAELRAGNRSEEIDQAIAQVAQAEAGIEDAEARVTLAEDRFRRNQSLQEEGAISQNELNDYINERDRAQATLR
ncbi:MAG: biotin/lipoyl-binding protein, partial [Cyanobacteria bacterium J06627_8]